MSRHVTQPSSKSLTIKLRNIGLVDEFRILTFQVEDQTISTGVRFSLSLTSSHFVLVLLQNNPKLVLHHIVGTLIDYIESFPDSLDVDLIAFSIPKDPRTNELKIMDLSKLEDGLLKRFSVFLVQLSFA